MNVEAKVTAMVVGKKEQNVNGQTYYSVSVVQNGEAGMLSCNQEVYGQVFTNPTDFRQVVFNAVYRDGQYKSLRLVSVDISATETLNGGFSSGTSAPGGLKDKK